MIEKIFAIRDNKADMFLPPFTSTNHFTAGRLLEMQLANNQNTMSQFPADYCLFEIGTWDDSTATIISAETKHDLGFLTQYVKREEQQ